MQSAFIGKLISLFVCRAFLFFLMGNGNSEYFKGTHRLSNHPLYRLYWDIRNRCYREKTLCYPRYGGKGVIMCDEWKNSFEAFYYWCINNGWAKGLQIDKDIKWKEKYGTLPGKLYSPEFCSFVTQKVNGNNTKATLFFEYKGETKCFADWCEIYGLNRKLSHQKMFRDGFTLINIIEGTKPERANGKLTDSQVLMIIKSKLSSKILAKKYNVNKTTIDSVLSGRNWSKLTRIKHK